MRESEEQATSRKSRSPRFPSRSLETCERWARAIYDAEKRNATAAIVAARRSIRPAFSCVADLDKQENCLSLNQDECGGSAGSTTIDRREGAK